MSLSNLPSEIVAKILGNLNSCSDEDKKTLMALSRSSHRLHSLSTPHLYQFFTDGDDWNAGITPLPLLLRSLLRNPELGKFIQHVDVRSNKSRMGEGTEQMDVMNDADWKLINKLISDIRTFYPYDGIYSPVGSDEKWYANVKKGKWDAVFALTLYFLSAMQQLELSGWGRALDGDTDHVQVFMLRVARSQITAAQQAKSASGTDSDPMSSIQVSGMKGPLLPNFHVFCLSHRDMEADTYLYKLLPFMLPPSVEDCEAFYVYSDDQALLPDWHLNLRSLTLQYSEAGAGHLSELLKQCPKLESLSYSNGGMSTRNTVFNPPRLMPGLMCLTRTLKRLDLSAGNWELTECIVRDMKLGSLKAFEVLTHVSLRLNFLVGQGNPELSQLRLEEIMPRSLQKLYLLGEAEVVLLLSLMEHFRRLVLRKEEVTPALRKIHISFWCKDEEPLSQELKGEKVAEMKSICKSKSVEFCLEMRRSRMGRFMC